MNKLSKIVFSIVFVILFLTIGVCIFRINQTQQAVVHLAEQFSGESARGTSGSFPAGYNPAGEKRDAPSAPTLSPSPSPTMPPATMAPAIVEEEPQGETVYWVPNGKVWHTTPNCSTLSRSSDIRSGTIEESGKSRACKKCG